VVSIFLFFSSQIYGCILIIIRCRLHDSFKDIKNAFLVRNGVMAAKMQLQKKEKTEKTK
jgi:hypothetical protein